MMAAMPMTLAPVPAWRPCALAQLISRLRAVSLHRAEMLVLDECSLASPALSLIGAGVFSKLSDDLGRHGSNVLPSVVLFQHVIASFFNAIIKAEEPREMSIFAREKSAFSREHSNMSFTAEAADLLGAIAGPLGSKKERQLRAWQCLASKFPHSTWTFNRVHDLFTQDPRARVRAQEIEELCIAARVEHRATKTQAYHDDLVRKIETSIALSRARRDRPSVFRLRELLDMDRKHDRALDQDS